MEQPFNPVTIPGCASLPVWVVHLQVYGVHLCSAAPKFDITHSTSHKLHLSIQKWLLFAVSGHNCLSFIHGLVQLAERQTKATTGKCLSNLSVVKTPGPDGWLGFDSFMLWLLVISDGNSLKWDFRIYYKDQHRSRRNLSRFPHSQRFRLIWQK